jgi:hypothetical protein
VDRRKKKRVRETVKKPEEPAQENTISEKVFQNQELARGKPQW